MLTSFQTAFLEKRGIPADEQSAFVEANISGLLDPALLADLTAAGDILEEAFRRQQHICIVGDFDADGVTATAVLLMGLSELGFEHVSWYINSRFELGYGFQTGTLEEILSRGPVDVIITVDNGISSLAAVAEAKARGITVIVTDHHEPQAQLPAADAVINPKRLDCPYPDKNLAGVGVAFKLLYYLFNRRELPRRALRYLDIVAIGTVADVMPLLGENRIMVKNGLKLINWEHARAGIKAIRKVFGISGEVDTYHLGFMYGPALNAQGRIQGTPALAIELLTTRNLARAEAIARQLLEINRQRQETTKKQVEQVLTAIGSSADRFIVYFAPDLHEGIVGLIAGRVKEKYGVPTLILTSDHQEGIVKGSARSVPGFDMKQHLVDDCSELLQKGGGHAMAAGVSLPQQHIEELKQRLLAIADRYPEHIFHPKPQADFEFAPAAITLELVEEIEAMAPFGAGFNPPVLKVQDFAVKQRLYMGKEQQHLKLTDRQGLAVVAFGQGESYLAQGEPGVVSALGCPAKNQWQGKVSVQFMVKGSLLMEDNADF